MADSPDLFEVETVLSRRTRKGIVEYLVRWKDYSGDYDTWEPQHGLLACRIIVNLYNKRHGYPLMGGPKRPLGSLTNSSKIVAKERLNKAKGKHNAKKKTVLKSYPVRSRQLQSSLRKKDSSGTKVMKTGPKNRKILKAVSRKKCDTTSSQVSKEQKDGKSVMVLKKKKEAMNAKKSDKEKSGQAKTVKVKAKDDASGNKTITEEDEDEVRYMLAPSLLKQLEKELKREKKRVASKTDEPKRKKIKVEGSEKHTKKVLKKAVSPSGSHSEKKMSIGKIVKVEKKFYAARRASDASSRGKVSPKAAGKLLALKPLHVKTEFVEPVSVPKAPVTKMESKLLMPAALDHVDYAAIYKTPPTSPSRMTRSNSNTPSRPSTPVHNGYFADLPTMPVVPTLPSSPSTDSYRSLITDLPQKLQATKLLRRGGTEEAEEIKRRVSVRQSESAFKYRDIVVKKCAHYTQIWLFTNTKFRNALNPHVFQELISAFHNAKYDDSRLVMLSGTGSIFCSGIDLFYLSQDERKSAVKKMVALLREFIKTLISFPKPIVAVVNGPAIGLGAAILPLCDIVYASDKAEFYMPYTRLAQTPEGCASFMFPNVMGLPLANEMLLGGRKLTAIEAYQNNLVAQVYWPTSMMQEVIPKVESMASQSATALEATKLLVRSHLKAKMDYTNESECNMIYESWLSTEFHRAVKKYLVEEEELLH